MIDGTIFSSHVVGLSVYENYCQTYTLYMQFAFYIVHSFTIQATLLTFILGLLARNAKGIAIYTPLNGHLTSDRGHSKLQPVLTGSWGMCENLDVSCTYWLMYGMFEKCTIIPRQFRFWAKLYLRNSQHTMMEDIVYDELPWISKDWILNWNQIAFRSLCMRLVDQSNASR